MVSDIDGPIHDYLDASPGCWERYGEILAREYGEYGYPEVHRQTVDAYAIQHPGVPARSARDPRAIQSLAVHLISLYLVLECGLPARAATEGMRRVLRNRERFHWLQPPASLGEMTVVDVLQAENLAEHEVLVRRWAQSAWDAWTPHHSTVRCWGAWIDG